jgi:hypothetical protein
MIRRFLTLTLEKLSANQAVLYIEVEERDRTKLLEVRVENLHDGYMNFTMEKFARIGLRSPSVPFHVLSAHQTAVHVED